MASYARVADPRLRRLRSLKMLELLLQGKSYTEVARNFNTTRTSVRRAMEFLDKEGILSTTEDQILKELYPLALQVYKKHLQEQLAKVTDVDVAGARDILKLPLKRAGMSKQDPSNDAMTLEEWVIRRKLRRAEVIDVSDHGPVVRNDHLLNPPSEDAGWEGESGDNDQREDD